MIISSYAIVVSRNLQFNERSGIRFFDSQCFSSSPMLVLKNEYIANVVLVCSYWKKELSKLFRFNSHDLSVLLRGLKMGIKHAVPRYRKPTPDCVFRANEAFKNTAYDATRPEFSLHGIIVATIVATPTSKCFSGVKLCLYFT